MITESGLYNDGHNYSITKRFGMSLDVTLWMYSWYNLTLCRILRYRGLSSLVANWYWLQKFDLRGGFSATTILQSSFNLSGLIRFSISLRFCFLEGYSFPVLCSISWLQNTEVKFPGNVHVKNGVFLEVLFCVVNYLGVGEGYSLY